jgi:RNA polymerase primary sigma factor
MSLKELYELEDVAATARREALIERSVQSGAAKDGLVPYFREMSNHALLTPEEEVRLAREIEDRELDVWVKVLTYPATVEHLLQVVEACMENSVSEFRVLRRAAARLRKTRSKPARQSLEQAAWKTADRLRRLDIDQNIKEAVFAELRAFERGRAVRGTPRFTPTSRSFKEYIHGVAEAERSAVHARNRFVQANLGLVVSVARRYAKGGLSLADLIQEGNLGLMKAVSRFDHRRGFRFSTYATWWIRHSIGRALADKGRTVRVPVHLLEAKQRISKTQRELSAKLGRTPTAEEIAVATEMPTDRVERIMSHATDGAVSLDAPLGDDEGRVRMEVFQTPETDDTSPFEDLAAKALAEHVRSLLHTLKPIEADVLRRRFGLDDGNEVTLQEIANSYGLSRERIRQIQEQALSKVRRSLGSRDVTL